MTYYEEKDQIRRELNEKALDQILDRAPDDSYLKKMSRSEAEWHINEVIQSSQFRRDR